MIYVSSSTGNDQTGNGTEQNPFRTIARAKNEIRYNGYPDWVLLKRGDTFLESFNGWGFSGRSETEPFVITSYGPESDPRPIITPPGRDEPGMLVSNSSISHTVYSGLHLKGRREGSAASGILAGGAGTNRLLEDMLIEGFLVGVFMESSLQITNVRMRRVVIADQWSPSAGHSQGLLANNIDGLTIEDSIFDHNGWKEPGIVSPNHSGQAPTIFNHNFYLYGGNKNVTIRRTIVSRASSNGISDNCSGTIEDNLVIRNPIGIFARTQGTTIRGNVVLNGTDLDPATIRGFGIIVGRRWDDEPGTPRGDAIVENNIIARGLANGRNPAISVTTSNPLNDSNQIFIRNNTVYDWGGYDLLSLTDEHNYGWHDRVSVTGNIFHDNSTLSSVLRFDLGAFNSNLFSFANNQYWTNKVASQWFTINNLPRTYQEWLTTSAEPNSLAERADFFEPTRSVESYHTSLGQPGTFEAFITEAKKQRKGYWRPEYETLSIIQYIRDGFSPASSLR